jgi:aryl-phospho-beta-D-glucosidase BglC (GH1 family)
VLDPNDYGAGKWVETYNQQPYTEANWLRDLVFIAARYKALPHFLGIDIFNEPSDRVRWASSAGLPDAPVTALWKPLAEKAATAILAANPNLLIFVQGITANWDGKEDQNIPINWGENLRPQSYAPLAIAADKLVLSPHSYGPDVSYEKDFDAPNYPANLATNWEILFGQFSPKFAVVPGEWGGRYGVGGRGLKDKQWQDAFVDYLIGKGMRSSFYWCWSPNSGDTGGILADNLTVREDKMALLRRLWGAS